MLRIEKVETAKQRKQFVKFAVKLYKNNPYCVLPANADDLMTLSPKKNPAFKICDVALFLCYNDDEIVGRIAVIAHHKANQTWKQNRGRFGWYDFVEDFEVAKLLMDTAINWLTEKGLTAISGPQGFTDFDYEGMLVEGFDQVGTMMTLYNYPYYPQFMERMGFQVDATWLEYKIFPPEGSDETKYARMADIVAKRNNVRMFHPKTPKQLVKEGWAQQFFDLLNVSYAPLYGFIPLTQEQKEMYIKQFIPLLRCDLISLIVNENNKLIGLGLALPSLSKALQKNQGKLFPFGFLRILRALGAKKLEVCDLMLIAVHPDYQNKGINAMIFSYIITSLMNAGIKFVESNPELESNTKMRGNWENFNTEQHKKRCVFIKEF